MTVGSRGVRRRPLVIGTAAVFVVLLVVQLGLAAVGAVLFGRASNDPLRPVDAIIVLGGEHDGREAYGIELARSGLAPVVLLSNPYPSWDDVMPEMCAASTDQVKVICQRPDPSTTRGEAIMTRRLAAENGWSSVMVITWRFHLPRARYIFEHCFSDRPDAVRMQAVPRAYDFGLLGWQATFLYQYAGFAKAVIQGSCD